MFDLVKRLFGKNKVNNEVREKKYMIRRMGKTVVADSVFHAWSGGDISAMVNELETPTNPVDRHYLLQMLISETYKKRQSDSYARELCKKAGEIYMHECEKLLTEFKKHDDLPPVISAFKYYSMILAEEGNYLEAIKVCDVAINLDVHDGTVSGFDGRKQRLLKKLEIDK